MSTGNIDLAAHIASLRKREESKPVVASSSLIFWGTGMDKQYLSFLKGCIGHYNTFVRTETVSVLTTVKMYCKQKGITKVIKNLES